MITRAVRRRRPSLSVQLAFVALLASAVLLGFRVRSASAFRPVTPQPGPADPLRSQMAHEDSAPVERSIRNPFLPAGDVVEEDFGGVLSDEHNVGIAMGSPPPNVQGIGMGPNGVFAIAGAPGIEPRIVRLGASVGTWRLERIDEGVASFVAGDGEQVEIRLR